MHNLSYEKATYALENYNLSNGNLQPKRRNNDYAI